MSEHRRGERDHVLGISFRAHQEPSLAMRMGEGESPRPSVFDNLKVYPGADFGAETPDEYIEGILESIFKDPDRPVVTFGLGEPGNGKTTVASLIAAKLLLRFPEDDEEESTTLGKSRLQEFADQHGYTIKVSMLAWGEASESKLIPAEWKIDRKLDYNVDPDLHAAKQKEVAYPEAIMTRCLARTIREANEATAEGKKVINIILGDVPMSSGDIIDGEQIGILRAHHMMHKLARGEGEFEGLLYKLAPFTLSASKDVRDKALKDREIIEQVLKQKDSEHGDTIVVSDVLESSGIHVNSEKQEVAEAVAREVAPPGQMRLIREDTNKVLHRLWHLANERVRPSSFYGSELPEYAFNEDRFRTAVVAVVQNPHILESLGLSPDDHAVANLYNETVVEEVNLFADLIDRRPIEEFIKTIIEEIKEEEEQGRKPHELSPHAAPLPSDGGLRGRDLY